MSRVATIRGKIARKWAGSIHQPRFDLARLPWLRKWLDNRWPLFLARSITLAGFVFTILVGLFGPPVGSHNFAIIFVWIAWWSALKLVFIPLGGRLWCSVCPLPMPGEWLQQGGLITRAQKRLGFGWRWPNKLRGYGLQASLFLVIGLFSAVTLTDPRTTAWVLAGLIFLAVLFSLLFERRAFCSHVCPIGGFTGIYAMTSPVELRVKENAICATHSEKTCYIECPWGVYPLALKDNAPCGLCMECLRVCPKDNIALNLRPFGADLSVTGRKRRLDEAFMALVMLGSALTYAAVFTGHWGSLKNAAYNIGSSAWLMYAAGFLILNLLIVPGAYTLAVWMRQILSHDQGKLRQAMADQFPALIPLGMFAWIAFTISFALPKMNSVFEVLSDPLGVGSNWLGFAAQSVHAKALRLAPFLQVAALMVGLFTSLRWVMQDINPKKDGAGKVSPASLFSAVPVTVFCLTYTILLLVLLVG
jgi:polyferredoxin